MDILLHYWEYLKKTQDLRFGNGTHVAGLQKQRTKETTGSLYHTIKFLLQHKWKKLPQTNSVKMHPSYIP